MNTERQKEQQRLDWIKTIIDKKTVYLKNNMEGLKENIINIRKTFWDDVTVNLDEPDDVGETFTSIKQQAEMLSERERSHGQFYQQWKKLHRLKKSPYFGRIDFLEEGESKAERIYLGITSLMDEKEETFLIYDWRAPISSLYYDYAPGAAKYETPIGTIHGNMELKRQFIIREGKLLSMFDTGVTIGDDLLQEVLGNQADTQMKSIVATIQKEQNQVIRNERSKYLIVQGVAGSGKTSAALQRVAYLLYRYRKSLQSENIMLFSPNPLFNSYVATVLPELGEDNMEQTTFQSYLENRLGREFHLEDPFSQMEYLLTAMEEPEYQTRLTGIAYKASLSYKELIDKYVALLSEKQLLFKKISFRGKTLISAQQINQYFYSLETSISIPNRMEMTAKWLLKKLSALEKHERAKDWVIAESELLDREDYLKVYHKLQSNEDTFDGAEREQALIAKMIVKKYFNPIKRAVKHFKFIHMKKLYCQLFQLHEFIDIDNLPGTWNDIGVYTIKRIKQGELAYEDAAPYLYLQDRLEGRKANTKIRHLFIDEAQDYSPFQFAFLRQLFPYSRMTILGDINQAIYAHAMNAPTLISSDLQGLEHSEKMTFMKSYRSTQQIVAFTKEFIPGGETIEAFNRNGLKPTLTKVEKTDNLHRKIIERIRQLSANGHQTIAIICKTAAESKEAFEQLNNEIEIRFIDKKARTFDKGVSILPSYLAKGIEFDAVIIYNASLTQYGRESERKLFYTACTRAMHELHLFSVGEKSPFIAEASPHTYECLTD